MAGNRFTEGKATKLSIAWADRHEEVLKVPFLRTVVVILGSRSALLWLLRAWRFATGHSGFARLSDGDPSLPGSCPHPSCTSSFAQVWKPSHTRTVRDSWLGILIQSQGRLKPDELFRHPEVLRHLPGAGQPFVFRLLPVHQQGVGEVVGLPLLLAAQHRVLVHLQLIP